MEDPPRLDPAEVEAFFDEAWESTLSAGGKIPGAIVAVVNGNEPLLVKGYGTRDIRTGESIDPERTLFRIGSTSKLFTAILALQLVEEGRLDLEADVNTYLDEFQIEDTFYEPVRIRHLLSHLGGFDASSNGLFAYSNAHIDTTVEEMERQFRRGRKPDVVPGYDNRGLGLLGFIAGRLNGTDYPTAVRRRIFEPLGMRHSTVGVPDNRAGDAAACHELNAEGEVVICRPSVMRFGFRGAGDVSLTGADAARFMISLLRGGELDGERILQPETFAEFTDMDLHRLHPAIPGNGHIIYESDFAGRRAIGHNGGFDGFSTSLVLFRDSDIGVFMSVLTYPGLPHYANLSYVVDAVKRARALAEVNGYGVMTEVETRFAERFLPPAPIASALPAPETRDVPLSELAGRYVWARMNLVPWIDRLMVAALYAVEVKTAGQDRLLIGGGLFDETSPWLFESEDSDATIAFSVREDATVLASSSMVQYLKVPWHRNPTITLVPLTYGLLVLLTGWVYALLRRRSAAGRTIGLLGAAAGLLVLAGVLLELQYYGMLYFAHGPTLAMTGWRLLIHLGWLAAIAVIVLVIRNRADVLRWRGVPAVVGSVYVVLLTLSATAVAVLAPYWGMIGHFAS
jgi:CubicO group peptidase (beta-lactamase class C family)